jgi:amidophosphoribosyltransferase
MCGIAGFCLNPKHHVNTTELASQMLLDIEHRGYHATGVAWINKEGKRAITKAPISASKFINPRLVRMYARMQQLQSCIHAGQLKVRQL